LSETLQLEEVTILRSELHDTPKLLLEWTPRWDDFVTSIRPALARSGPRLAGEAPLGGFPYRGFLSSFLLQSLLVLALMALPREIDRLRPYAPPRLQPYEVIYYSGDELPRTQDLGGSDSGKSARSGGQERHHRTQTIHIARGSSLFEKVIDAPNLKLPASSESVANLLAFRSKPAVPSALPVPSLNGLHSPLTAPSLATNVIAPAQLDITRDHSRSALTLNSVVPPAPSVSSDKSRTAPTLDASVVPPAPNTPSAHTLIAPRLDSSVIAPAPNISRQRTIVAPSLSTNVIAPASTQIATANSRSAPALQTSIVPPAPTANGREVPSTRVQMTNVSVVPPPVSAPERDDVRNAKLSLPAPSVVAPPPSADSAHDLRRLESGVAASSPNVVPPPPTQTSSPSFVSNIIGKIFGTQDVVPPPPSVSSATRAAGNSLAANVVPPPPSSNISAANRASGGTLAPKVVPPPPSASATTAATSSRTSRTLTMTSSIVPPPPAVNRPENSTAPGTLSQNTLAANVVPPPPSVALSNPGTPTERTTTNDLAGNVVPPPPSINSASTRKGAGVGIADATVLAPPPAPVGNSDKTGVVVSAQPGSHVGVPGNTNKAALAMSPIGGEKTGLGGSGGGVGIGHGEGTGSSPTTETHTENSGASKSGSGHGSDATAHTGISPAPGPGGAGSMTSGSPAVPGVDVRGGSTIVTLPSFGSDGGDPSLPRRSNVKTAQGPAITIVATSRSGGAFDFYGKLPGDNYTVYVDTSIGTVVMQFAEVNPAAHPASEALTGPEAILVGLPANLPHARMVVKCKLTASGEITNLQVLEAGPATMTAKIVSALSGWKFRPAMRGAQPIEINAILGFNIDTNDRN
jgi:hypothetical protein